MPPKYKAIEINGEYHVMELEAYNVERFESMYRAMDPAIKLKDRKVAENLANVLNKSSLTP